MFGKYHKLGDLIKMTICHRILVIDDEKSIFSVISRILSTEDIKLVYAPSGEKALTEIENSKKPYSIIISDQNLGGMKGHEFFEKAKEYSPDSTRFLITGFSNMDALVEAINKGAIHKYISKPFEPKNFLEFVRKGLKLYEQTQEHDIFLFRAKENNKKLYDLTNVLNHDVKTHKILSKKLDGEISKLNKELEMINKQLQGNTDKEDWNRIERLFEKHDLLETETINDFFEHTSKEFFELFQGITKQNGFELPIIL
jgi:response regulator RpfG family c-di-GMP phosphodiesterase